MTLKVAPVGYARLPLPSLDASDRLYLTGELTKIEKSIGSLIADVNDLSAQLDAIKVRLTAAGIA